MTLEQAIAALEDPNVHSIVTDPGELKGWLIELKEKREQIAEYDKLLKSAVEDLRYLESHTVDEEGSCLISDRGERIRCFDCPFYNGGKVNEKCVWNYEAEALKLLGEQNDENN